MRFEHLLAVVGSESVFETGLLLAGDVDPSDVRRQLTRWTQAGRIQQLRRGLYMLAPPYLAARPHMFVVANRLVRPSYVSRESALAHHGLIPEHVQVVTSVTTKRPGLFDTPLGSHDYRHVKTDLFWGYRVADLGQRQKALVAVPEKALLDLVYLQTGADSPEFLGELRLQNLERMDMDELERQAKRSGAPKLRRAAAIVRQLAEVEAKEYGIS